MSEQMVMDFHAKQGLEPTLLRPASDDWKMAIWAAHISCKTHSRYLYIRENPNVYRAHLMLQELSEVLEALYNGDVVELADGLADLDYVTTGTSVQFGIPHDKVFAEVHRSNMTKGLVMNEGRGKGPSYSPPDIEGVLDADR